MCASSLPTKLAMSRGFRILASTIRQDAMQNIYILLCKLYLENKINTHAMQAHGLSRM